MPKSNVTTEPNRRHVVVTLLNRLLRRRNSGHLQLANQTQRDRRFWCDVTTGQASSCASISLLQFKRQAGNRTRRVLDHRALAEQDFCAVFSQHNVADRCHVRVKFRSRNVAGRRVIVERKLLTALATHAGTFPHRITSRTNRRDVVDRPVTSHLEKFPFF